MHFRSVLSSDTEQHIPLRNSSDDTTNYQSTQQTSHPFQYTLSTRALTFSSTFCTPNAHNSAHPINAYIVSSDFSSNSVSNDADHIQNAPNPYSSNCIQQQQQQIVNASVADIMNDDMLLPEALNHSISAPFTTSFNKRRHSQTDIEYMDRMDIDDDIDDEEDESVSYLDNDMMHELNVESSSGSCCIYTNSPSVIPLVCAFGGMKACSERFDIGVIALSLSQTLNYISLKVLYPFAGFIYPILGITYLQYVVFLSFANLATLIVFLIQPLFEYLSTNYVLFVLQLIIIASNICFIVFYKYFGVVLCLRMVFILCLNCIWVHSNGAIRSFTMNNIVLHSRRNLLLHSSWQWSTFLLSAFGYIWWQLNQLNMRIPFGISCSNSLFAFDIILLFLSALTLICSVSYLWLIPTKKLRIKYYDESTFNVIARTLSLIANDLMHITASKYVNLLIIVNVLGAISSMMILFIFGIWLQTLLDLNIKQIAMYTLIEAIAQLFVIIVNLSKCMNRTRLSTIAIGICIIFVVLLFGVTYITLINCRDRNEWFCHWLSIVYTAAEEEYVNKSILIVCLFGILFGHETFVTTIHSCIWRECRRNNTPNAAYPLCNIIGGFATFIGQLLVGILWVYAGQVYSMLPVLLIMFIIDVLALLTLCYAFKLYKK